MKHLMYKVRKVKSSTKEENESTRSGDEDEDSNNFQLFLRTSTRFSSKRKGVSVVWQNLSVTAEIKERSTFKKTQTSYKRLIHNVTGAIFPGNLVAIMGASGSGKTTLMSVLANRNPSALKVEGEIRINGKPTGAVLKQISGYVYQDDLFNPSLTVMEHLYFAAKLRLDKNLDEEDRTQLILKVIREVGLLKLVNVTIGSSNAGKKMHLSGGESKRLSVATELLTEAQLLFCDEPTTGLDSYSALKLITMMQNLVNQSDKTIVCSIHQPSKQIFELFKQIVLMSDGRIVFNGSPADAVKFFESQGFRYNEEQNPAEYFIRSIADKRKNDAGQNLETVLHSDFWKSKYSQDVRKYVGNAMKQNDSIDFFFSKLNKIQTLSWFSKLMVITHRGFLTLFRASSDQNIRIGGNIILALLIGLCLNGTVKKTQIGLRALQATVYITVAQNFFPPFYAALAHIRDQIPLFYREYSNNSITPSIFYLSNIISLLPGFFIDPIAYSMIIYYFAGLQPTYFAVIMSSLVSFLLFNGSAAFGIFFSMLFQNNSMAISVASPILNMYLFCCGFLIKLSSIPYVLSFIYSTSLFTYACAALYIIQLKDLFHIECETKLKVACFRNGLEVLKYYEFDEHSLSYNLSVMLIICLTFHMLAYLCLLYRIKNRSV